MWQGRRSGHQRETWPDIKRTLNKDGVFASPIQVRRVALCEKPTGETFKPYTVDATGARRTAPKAKSTGSLLGLPRTPRSCTPNPVDVQFLGYWPSPNPHPPGMRPEIPPCAVPPAARPNRQPAPCAAPVRGARGELWLPPQDPGVACSLEKNGGCALSSSDPPSPNPHPPGMRPEIPPYAVPPAARPNRQPAPCAAPVRGARGELWLPPRTGKSPAFDECVFAVAPPVGPASASPSSRPMQTQHHG